MHANAKQQNATAALLIGGAAKPTMWLLLALAVVAYAAFLSSFMSFEAGGSDSSGYLNFAKLLLQGEVRAPVRALPGYPIAEFGNIYEPQGFALRDASGTMAPTYPVGLPLHLALATALAGAGNAVVVVNVLAALAAALLMYASCRHLKLDPPWALGATLTLCACPFFINSALQPMSDLLATTWALATLYAAMRSRERTLWAFLCGGAGAIAVLVRPSNALLAFPILVAFGLSPRRYLWAALAAIPGVLFESYVSWKLFASPPFFHGTTGYSNPLQIFDIFNHDRTKPFSVVYLANSIPNFSLWIFLYLSPLVVCAFALPFFAGGRTRDWATQAVWFLVVAGCYSLYQPAGEVWWYLRFLLPAFPALIMLATGGAANIWKLWEHRHFPPFAGSAAKWSGAAKTIVIVALLVLSIGWSAAATLHLPVLNQRGGAKLYAAVPQWALDHLPANAVILCSDFSGSFYYYTSFPIVRYDALQPAKTTAFLQAAGNQQRPLYVVVWPRDLDQTLARLGGHWVKLAEVGEQKITVLQLMQ